MPRTPSPHARCELVEWLGADGRVISVVTRARMRSENLRHRSVSIAVLGSDGRLLAHRRADHKDLLPGWWDVCVGGVIGVGEHPDAAARRELAEELGVDDAVPEWVAVARHDDEHAREISQVYRVVHDGPFTFADGEIAEARWVTPTELAALSATEPVLPGSLRMVLPHVPGFEHLDRAASDA